MNPVKFDDAVVKALLNESADSNVSPTLGRSGIVISGHGGVGGLAGDEAVAWKRDP